MMKLFGTDGIRGTANKPPMTPDIVLKVGQAMGFLLRNMPHRKGDKRMVLIGKDTRLSGYMVEQALASGLNSMGVGVQLTGPLPTPGIGFLARNMRVDAGIIISASHNPYFDNGIKIFGADGFKIPDTMEKEIERLVSMEDLSSHLADSGEDIGRTRRIDDAAGRYIVFAKNTFPLNQSLEGMRLVLDCANGAAYKVAPAIFSELGAEVIVLSDDPNGYNINDKAGALFPIRTCEAVIRYRADVGISLDGDADRVIMVDNKGEIRQRRPHSRDLRDPHGGQENAETQHHRRNSDEQLRARRRDETKQDSEVVRTDVGDKNVVECMRQNDYNLGGEQSGHIIHLDHSTTGDGCIAALNVLGGDAVRRQAAQSTSQHHERRAAGFDQHTRFGAQRAELGFLATTNSFSDIQKKLGAEGRLFVRFSGTEPVVRVLVEGPDKVDHRPLRRRDRGPSPTRAVMRVHSLLMRVCTPEVVRAIGAQLRTQKKR